MKNLWKKIKLNIKKILERSNKMVKKIFKTSRNKWIFSVIVVITSVFLGIILIPRDI